MGGLVGIIRLDGAPVYRAILDRWKKGNGGLRPDRVRSGACWAFARERGPVVLESSEPQPFELATGALLFVDARLDEREHLARTLQLDERSTSDRALAAAACTRWGPDAASRLYGDFIFAHWDASQHTLTLARDALGVWPLYYVFDGQSVAFATSIHLLLALPDTPHDIDELGIADMFVGASDAPERTLYRHIRRVEPGAKVRFRPGESRSERYWTLGGIASVNFARDDDYVEAGRELLDRAVASRIRGGTAVATMLSGGFDSAGVTATAARLLGDRRLTAYTRVAGAPHPYQRLDEQAFAGKVAERYANIDWVVVDKLHSAARDIAPEWEAAASGVPTNGFGRTWYEPIHDRVAASGAGILLIGRRGNASLSWSGAGLPLEHMRRGRWVAAVREVVQRARQTGSSVASALRKELTPAIEPAALRRWRMNRRNGPQRWEHFSAISPEFLRSVDYLKHADSTGHDMLRFLSATGPELRMFLLQSRSDEGAHAHGKRPYAMLDPLGDRKLAEFTLGTPENQFRRDGVGRWLARRVLADRLPADLLAQNQRGKQVAEWYTLANMRREHTAQEIERIGRSPLASRVLDVKQLKALVDNWPKDAEAAVKTEHLHRFALHQGVTIGSFLRWHEGSNG